MLKECTSWQLNSLVGSISLKKLFVNKMWWTSSDSSSCRYIRHVRGQVFKSSQCILLHIAKIPYIFSFVQQQQCLAPHTWEHYEVELFNGLTSECTQRSHPPCVFQARLRQGMVLEDPLCSACVSFRICDIQICLCLAQSCDTLEHKMTRSHRVKYRSDCLLLMH